MKEFAALLESELLTSEVKATLKDAIEKHKAELTESVRKDLEVEFAKKYHEDKKVLAENVINLVKEVTAAEIQELIEDIKRYSELEITYAKKLEEYKEEFAKKLSEDFEKMVSEQVIAEIGELKQDLQEAQKHQMGKRIFEAFVEEVKQFGVTEDEKKVREELNAVRAQLEESTKTLKSMQREKVLEGLLKNLTGTKRDVMKTILENVEVDKLETRYKEVIGSVINDKVDEVKTGTKPEPKTIVESDSKEIARMRQLAGNRK